MLVVFDLDGTVVDSTGALLAAHDAAWASLGLPRPPDEDILELTGLPLVQTMRTLAPDQDPDLLTEAFSRAYLKVAARHERLFDGMAELLARPFRAAVATGKSQRGAERVRADRAEHLTAEPAAALVLERAARPYPSPSRC